MFLFKLLFSFGLLMTDLPAMDAEGWVSVERPSKEAEAPGADERDPSIWVVFSKQIGSEKILISFPDEPTYRYMNRDGEQLEVFSSSGGIEHRFQMLNEIFQSSEEMLKLRLEQVGSSSVAEKKVSGNAAELLIWKDGFWIQEKLIRTDQHTFFLQTKAPHIERDSHRAFVQSFDLDLDRKFSF
jgi:hypothetical protein